jgi:poly(A) polymerase
MNVKEGAFEIVKKLSRSGYIAYFAGGWVRDFLMKHPSDDIDIATDAPPEAIMDLFPKTIPVGLAFGIVVVCYGGHNYEVATFRKDLGYTGGRRPDKIALTGPEEDALRRDFTINGMFYDPLSDRIIDYVSGMEDINNQLIRTIGDPHERFTEDRLRMIRAIRFAARFQFEIDKRTQEAIQANAKTLFPAVAIERVWQELNKMAKFPRFQEAIYNLHHLGLLPVIFPMLSELDIRTIQERISRFSDFPRDAPVILYLMELFPNMSLDELLDLCQYLKISVYEGKMIEFAYHGKQLLLQEQDRPHAISDIDWANFYAHKFFSVYFNVAATKYPEEQRGKVIQRHQERIEKLSPHIERIAKKQPLVTGSFLQQHGVMPGKVMGILLKEAERLAITQDIHDPNVIVSLLKETTLWPQEKS